MNRYACIFTNRNADRHNALDLLYHVGIQVQAPMTLCLTQWQQPPQHPPPGDAAHVPTVSNSTRNGNSNGIDNSTSNGTGDTNSNGTGNTTSNTTAAGMHGSSTGIGSEHHPRYELVATVMHSGRSSSSGHYTCYVRAPKPPGFNGYKEDGGGDSDMGIAECARSHSNARARNGHAHHVLRCSAPPGVPTPTPTQ